MTEQEKMLSELTKDMAVVVNIQKGCQKSQAITTKNIDKLASSVETLSHDTVYLRTLETRITALEEDRQWLRRKLFSTSVGIVVSVAGLVILIVFKIKG